MIVSNHLLGQLPLPDDVIIRINLAWIPDIETAAELIAVSKHDIYLDYPSGRTKPPRPTMTLTDALLLAAHPHVKYFAFSNAEDVSLVRDLQASLNKPIVPKIETATGVKILPDMIAAGITMVMLDKEDLYVNVGADSDVYEALVEEVRACGIRVLELQGVCFD